MSLWEAEIGKENVITALKTEDAELNEFLFTLGCYEGEKVTLISRRHGTCVIALKDSRYSIDKLLASAILI